MIYSRQILLICLFCFIIIIGDRMKILCIGHAAYDLTSTISEFPIENTKNRVHDRIECGGGPSATAAYLLGKWHMDTSFAGIIGKDLYGEKIKSEFESIGVNTKYLEMSSEHTTTSSFILANTSNGTRTIFTYRPSDMKMQEFELDFEPDIILMDGQEYEMSKKLLEKYPNAISIIDAGRSRKEIIELSKMVTYLVCSKEFAENVSEIKFNEDFSNKEEIYHKLESIFHNNIVVTLEAKGCLYKLNNQLKIMPSIKVKAVDSTGAGDIFHGAFTYGIAKGYDFEKVLKLSNIAGAISVTRIGTRASIPTLEEMEEVYNAFK